MSWAPDAPDTTSGEVLDGIPCGIVEMDAGGRIIAANTAFADIVQHERTTLAGVRFQDLLARGAAIFYETQFSPSLLLRGNLREISFELSARSGDRIPVFVNAVFRKGDQSREDRIVLAVFVAKERRQYEAELLRARKDSERLADVVRRSSDAIIRFSGDAHIETWNDGAEKIFGYTAKDAIGRSLSSLFDEDKFRAIESSIANLAAGHDVNRETEARQKSGDLVSVSISMTPHIEAPGILVGFSVIIRDATRARQAERALLQTEKLASVGRLASSIAHEINNPLESVTNLLYILRSRVHDDESKALVQTAEEELARVSQIANHTLRFHKQSTSKSEIELQNLVDNVLGLYRARLQNSGIVVINESGACSPLLCYENEIRQVLLNLVANAFDAMRSGGRLRIRCRDVLHGPSGAPSLRITIADTGTGMDQQTLSNLFEAFFSTKGIGGTGLGLWVSKDLIARNGGVVRVRSSQAPGRNGTAFVIWFPKSG
ncbi:MAG TPA: PAS domain S-box protein [Acidobacteriaceae bacterium]|nr:PAS domain S-box protein [Acidobacteriaceae bacterium]